MTAYFALHGWWRTS
ncbi:trp operon leader peptide [Enterobacter hormaechei]|nr:MULTISPECIES: trp operon leader peptide [Enterobacter]RTY48052.1 trp operon leader peptide [Enterobacter hormaechei subsp. steigerwaltii]UNC52482.1 trp operon leader peptide [Enterobacter huaxiensis]